MSIFFIIAIIASIVGFVAGLTPYILRSLGLYSLAKNRGIDAPWLAWIPVGNAYIMGCLCKASPYIKKKFPKMHIIYPVVSGAYLLLAIIMSVGFIIAYMPFFKSNLTGFSGIDFGNIYVIIYYIVIYLAALLIAALGVFVAYHIYKVYDPANAVLYTVLSAIGLSFIFLFVIRNKQPVIEEDLISQ